MNEPLPFNVKWKLPDLLEREGVSVYRLDQELTKKVGRTTLYRWANGMPERPDLTAMGWILWGLHEITGKPYALSDLLEYETGTAKAGISAAGIPYTGDPETDDVLDDHPDILERLARLERGETKLIPWERVKEELGL